MSTVIKNLQFQPLTFPLAHGGGNLYLQSRETRTIPNNHVSQDLKIAVARGLLILETQTDQAVVAKQPAASIAKQPKRKRRANA